MFHFKKILFRVIFYKKSKKPQKTQKLKKIENRGKTVKMTEDWPNQVETIIRTYEGKS